MNTKYETEPAQTEAEISWFADLLRKEGVRSYLEIGCRYGGSVWRIGKALKPGARIVTVDLPAAFGGREDGRVNLEACLSRLTDMGHHCQAIWGNSADPDVITQAVQASPFDAIFIDADHRIDAVTKDWETYSSLGRIIAFHDIAWHRSPEFTGKWFGVPEFWNRIKVGYRHKEMKLSQKDNGIGVLWRE